jgi:hypothetical protein
LRCEWFGKRRIVSGGQWLRRNDRILKKGLAAGQQIRRDEVHTQQNKSIAFKLYDIAS